jgi:hypothetical protein
MKPIRYVLVFAAVIGLAGCASPPTREAMSVSTPVARSYPYSVSVQTRGGAETSAMAGSNLSDDDLKGALEKSIVDTKLFRAVVQGKDGDYELAVAVTQMSRPVFGLSFTVELETAWSLTKMADKKVLMRKVVKSSQTASVGDAFVGVTRLRIAVEGAVRKNIEQGLQAIAELGSLD